MRFILVIALALAVSGCSGSDRPEGPSRSATADARQSDEMQQVEVAYEDYWVQLLDALDPPDPRHVGLLGRVSGKERQAVKQLIALRKSSGELVRGSYEHEIAMGDPEGTHVELTDCLTPRTRVFAASSGRRIRTDPPGPYPVAASLANVDGSWKVIAITSASHACPRPPDHASDPSEEKVGQDGDSSK